MKVFKGKVGLLIVLLFLALGAFAQGAEPAVEPASIFGIGDIFKLLGALGLFLFGMKFMSEGIQKAAGNNLRKILGGVTSNRFFGIVTGLFVTTLIQSSSATTVMVVSFANAGLFTLTESISVIMGANIGTTITGWIIAVFGLDVSVADLALPVLGLSFPFLFFSNERLKNWAEFVVGFGLLFFGIGLLKESVPDIEGHTETLNFISKWASMGIWSTLIFIGIGTLLTIVVQSSSATMALTLIFLSDGWIDFPTAAAMILGENIGTTITAQIAGLIANINAKRAAMAHTLFNLTGVLWMLIFFHPFLEMVEWIMKNSLDLYCSVLNQGCELDPSKIDVFNQNSGNLKAIGTIGLAIFHTSFNVINVILLVGFVPLIAKVVQRILPTGTQDNESVLKYLDSGMMNTPELALIEVQKEVMEFAILVNKMYRSNLVLLYKDANKKSKKAFAKIAKYEDECDDKEREIARFLASLSTNNLSRSTASRIRQMWSVINDLERIGDLNEKIMINFQRKSRVRLLNEDGMRSIRDLTDLLEEGFAMMFRVLGKPAGSKVTLASVKSLEEKINKHRDDLRNSLFIEVENGTISFETGLVAVELVSNFEKIADHIYSINTELIIPDK